MADIENSPRQYLPQSSACSCIYFTIKSLHQVHFLYQFSLQIFLDIYHSGLVFALLLARIHQRAAHCETPLDQ